MKLSCGTVRDLLPAYSDKTASPTTMLLVKEHLRGCPDCRRELDAIHRSANKPAQQEAAAHELNYVGPVSYTHLDVYKRQGLGRPHPVMHCILRFSLPPICWT